MAEHDRSREAFESLTLPHLPGLYRLALRLTGQPSTAEDLVQETFLKALCAFGSLRDATRAKAWLFQILSRLVTDRHRASGREIPLPDDDALDRFSLYERIAEEDPFPYSDDLHGDFMAQFRDEDVRRALLGLPEVYRLPLVRVYVEEMSYRELAEVLDCPIGTVMSRLHLAACLDCCDKVQFSRRVEEFIRQRLGDAAPPAGLADRIRRGLASAGSREE